MARYIKKRIHTRLFLTKYIILLMPFRRKRRASWRVRRVFPSKRFKSSRRRVVRRKRVLFRRGSGGRVSRNLGLLMPNQILTKFKAFDTWILECSAVYTPRIRLYTNNPYDPVVGVSSTKCTGFDDLMGLFTYGVCYGCKVVLRPVMYTNNAEVLAYIKHYMSTEADLGWLSLNQIMETNMVKSRIVYSCNPILGWTMGNVRPFNTYVNIKRLEKKKELEASYYFTKTSGPGSATIVDLGYRHAKSDLVPADNPFTVRTIISITYYCKLFSKKTMTE